MSDDIDDDYVDDVDDEMLDDETEEEAEEMALKTQTDARRRIEQLREERELERMLNDEHYFSY